MKHLPINRDRKWCRWAFVLAGVSVVSWGLCQPTVQAASGDEWQPITGQPTLVGTYDENNFPEDIWTPVTTDADYHDVLSDGDRGALPTGEMVPEATPTQERTPVDFGQVAVPDQGQVTVASETGNTDQQGVQPSPQQQSGTQQEQQVIQQQSGIQQAQQTGQQQVSGQIQSRQQEQAGLQIQMQVPQQLQTNQTANQYLAIEITGIKDLQQLQRRQVQVLIGGKPIAAGMISDFRCEQGRVKLLLADQTIVDTMDHVRRLAEYAGQTLTIILPMVSRNSQSQTIQVNVEYGTGQRSSDGTNVVERQARQQLAATTVIDWLKQHLANFDLRPTVINHDDHSVTNTDNHHDITNTTVISQPDHQASATEVQGAVVTDHERADASPKITMIDRHDVTNNNYYQVTNDNHQTVTNQDHHDVITNRDHHDVTTTTTTTTVTTPRTQQTRTQAKQVAQAVVNHQAAVTTHNQASANLVSLSRQQLVSLLQQVMRQASVASQQARSDSRERGHFNHQGSWWLVASRKKVLIESQHPQTAAQPRLPQTGASDQLVVACLGLGLLLLAGVVIKKVY